MKSLKGVIFLSELASFPKKRRKARGADYASERMDHGAKIARQTRNRIARFRRFK